MSGLQIAYNDIPRKAVVTAASSEDADHPHENLFHGSSTLYWKRAASGTQSTFTVDLGAGVTRAVDHVIFHGVDLLLAAKPSGTVDLELRGSTDNFSASNDLILDKQGIVSADLSGPYGEDLVLTLSALSTAYRYWRIVIDSSASFTHLLRKAYFGQFFQFEDKDGNPRSPSYPYNKNLTLGASGFESDAGTIFKTSRGRAQYKLDLVWRAVAEASRKTFFEEVVSYLSDFPVFLYAADDFGHSPLPYNTLFGWMSVESNSGDEWKDFNTVSANFLQDIFG